jgi:prepilin-type N-terminal cleavage/methylation domain-containing protein/prepilin-type processing-associated H-X9-DG protein
MISSQKRGFTLIELLTTIAVIGVLITIVFSVYRPINQRALIAKSQSNLRQISVALQLFVNENDGILPYSKDIDDNFHWYQFIGPYLGGEFSTNAQYLPSEALVCPAWDGNRVDRLTPVNGAFRWQWGFGINYIPEAPESIQPLRTQRGSSNAHSTTIRKANITEPSNRIWVASSSTWHLGLFRDANRVRDVNRHGNDRANALYFDGSVRLVNAEQFNRGVDDPASRP